MEYARLRWLIRYAGEGQGHGGSHPDQVPARSAPWRKGHVCSKDKALQLQGFGPVPPWRFELQFKP